MNRENKNNLGFSLIEIIVSIAILGVFISVVFGVIFYVNKSNDSIKASSDIQNNVKNSLDYISSNIRSNGINYNYYRVGNNYNINIPMNNIALNNNIIYRKTNNCYGTMSCIEASLNNGSTFEKMTYSNTNISRLDFIFLDPDTSTMPIVTVVLSGYVKDAHGKNSNFYYQNTVEIKNYIK